VPDLMRYSTAAERLDAFRFPTMFLVPPQYPCLRRRLSP
jgi:hypothetical protein